VGLRLAPLFASHGVAWATLWPMMSSASAVVFEAALILGTPLGVGLGMREELLAAASESAGSSRLARGAMGACIGFVALWVVVTSAIGAYVGFRVSAPGMVARGVVQGAREDCMRSGRQHRTVRLPAFNARWDCSPSHPPRLSGELSNPGMKTSYSARDVQVSEDLSFVELAELEIDMSPAHGKLRLHMAVQGARLHGVLPWMKPRSTTIGRAICLAGLAGFLGLVEAFLLLKSRLSARTARVILVIAAANAVVGAVTAWTLLAIVDAHANWGRVSYLMIPVAAGGAMIGLSTVSGNGRISRLLAFARRRAAALWS
jgi:hypothetical protein